MDSGKDASANKTLADFAKEMNQLFDDENRRIAERTGLPVEEVKRLASLPFDSLLKKTIAWLSVATTKIALQNLSSL